MNIKKLPAKMIAIIALSSVFLVACDDTRVRVSASSNNYHSGHHYLSHTPHNHRVRYDSALGLYALIGLSNVYWDNGNYYRYHNNGWQYSRDYRRWSGANQRNVPSRLYKRYHRAPVYDRSRVRITPNDVRVRNHGNDNRVRNNGNNNRVHINGGRDNRRGRDNRNCRINYNCY